MFIIAIAVRVVLFFVVSPVFDTLSLNMIVALFFYAFFLGSFCVVSYHTDAILEERLQKKMDQEGDTLTKPPKSSGVTSSGQNLDCKMDSKFCLICHRLAQNVTKREESEISSVRNIVKLRCIFYFALLVPLSTNVKVYLVYL